MLRTHYVDISAPLTEMQKKELERVNEAPIVFDEDCPELTPEQLKKFRRVSNINPDDRKKGA